MTRCKFTCQSVTKHRHYRKPGEFLFDARFTAVTSGSEENDSFFEATPSGELTVSTVKQDIFEPGRDYYIDISEAS